jgi:hypothetical protein
MPSWLLRTIRAFAAPKLRISCSSKLWGELTRELSRRTEGRHESGAFLLGKHIGRAPRQVSKIVYYDDLDPHAYDTGACVVRGPAFARLWELCRSTGLSVVADIHVHPGAAHQSWEDKTNPTLPHAGHVAIIVPNYAKPPIRLRDLGIYEYIGKYEWNDLGHARAKKHFYIGAFA